jgi:enamine deaminase RidA (YjgF/YER057c/UK114 family)
MLTTVPRLLLVMCATILFTAPPAAAQPAAAPSEHLEVIHHPGFDKTVNMPFVPAIKIASGKMLWLAGTTAVPVYHDHPHRRDEVVKHLPNDLEAQTRATMDGIKKTLEAAGATFGDVVHMFVFRTRPRIGDLGRASAVINSYFAPYNHKPTSTNLVVLELGEPEQLIEIQAVAVVD